MQARLADGRILNFPDGTDPSVVDATVKKVMANPLSAYTEEELKKVPTASTSTADFLRQVGQGGISGAKSLTDLFGAGNDSLSKANEYLGKNISPELQQEQLINQELQERAKNKGWFDELSASLRPVLQHPFTSVASGLASSVPLIAGAALAEPLGLGTAAYGGIGALMGLGGQKGQNYQTVHDEAIRKGKSEAEAEALGQQAAEYSLKNTPSLALGAVSGALEGEFAAPAKLGRFLNPAKLETGAIQNLAKPSFAKALGQSSLEGGGTEFLQGAGAQVGSNLALQNAGFDTPLFEGSLGQGAHDALIGALTGAAVSPAQLSSLKREYDADQAKVLTEQAAKKQKESADLITKFNEQNQIKPELLALPAPAQKIESKQAEQSLQNPHGNYTAEELGPERVEAIDTHRADNGKPPLNSYSIEDIVDAMPSQSLHPADTRVKNPEGERADLNALIANKVGHTNEKVTPQDVVNKAIERNVDPSGEGFKDFLRRTTGIGELNMMTDGQRFAAQQALQNMEPHTGEASLILPRGTNATHYDADQRLNAINALDQHGGPVSQEKAIETIKKATGLERDQDAQHMIAELVRSGDFDLNKDNELEQPSSTSYLPPGYHIEEGSFKEGEAPEHFKIMAADKELGTADTQEAAEEKKNKYLETRAKKSESIDKEIEQKQADVQKSKDDLEAMEAMGEGRTPAYQKASADHAALETNTQKEIGDLNRTKSELDPEVNPLSIKAGNIVPKTRKGFTIFKNNQSIGTFPDRSTAEKTIAANLTTKELEQLTGDKRRRSFARLADQELNDRVTTGIKVKVTKEFEQAAPELGKQLEAMLAKFGLKGVGLKLMSTLGGNEGEYAHSLIKIALDITDPLGVLRHESIHALKNLGFFSDNQWNALRRMAKDKWIQQYLKDKPFAEGKSRYDAYMEMYKGDMNAIEEEAIADAFRDFAKNGSPPGMIAALIKRLNEFFEAIKNVLSGNGFNTANDVFEKIEKGQLVSTKQGASETKASVKTAKWAEKEEAPDKFGREDALRRMYRKLNNAYTETDSPAEAYDLAYESSSPAEQRILRALKKDDFLGFDYPHQAIHEIIENPENYDISTPLKVALSVVGNKEGRASLKSPLEPYVSAQEAQERIQRRINRPAGVGSPTNQRIEFTNENGQKLVVGKITHEDWLNRVNTLMDKEEIKDSRNWYKQLHELFEPLFGTKSSDYALAWLLSQQRASPTKGLTDVLRASDIAQGKQKVMGAGLNEQALIDVLSGRIPKSGVGAKLLDFIDSELGLPARTYMKGDVRGRQPAAIDVWAQRDIGFVDPTIHEYIRKTFGEEAAKSVSVDKTVNGESQYEHGIDFYNDVVDMLNKNNYMGGGWTAREVQAVGWVTMQRALGIKAEFVRDIVNGNTRRISIGLAPGGGSVMAGKLMGKEIPVKSAQKVIDNLAKLAGIKVIQNVDGVGAYLTYVEGAIQIDAIASPESVADFMDMVGYAFQQTEIINTRALASGKNMAIDVMSNGLDTSDKAVKFFTEFLNHVPKKGGDPIAAGFQQITVDGKHGIRLLNFGGNWRQTQVKEIQDALNKTSILTDTRLNDVVVSQVVLSSTKNNWTEEHNGNTYLDSLRTRGRLQEAQQLQREYPPSRFDLTEDKGITWGGTRYSLGSTESTIRPSDRSDEGITLGQQQEGAVSYSGVHYGKEKTDVLKGSKYGTGLRGAERRRLEDHWDDRVKKRVYFYIPKATGEMPQRESGLGGHVYTQKFNNILGPGKEMSRLMIEARDNANEFESAIVDAGYDGYAVPNMGMMVVLNHDVPVKYQGTVSEVNKASLKAPNTPAFKRFFGNSKVVDANGEPLVVYHATKNFEGNEFKPSPKVNRVGNPDGYYFTYDIEDANKYAGETEGAQIIPAYLSIQNPFNYVGKFYPSKKMVNQYEKELRQDNPNLKDDWINAKLDTFKDGYWPNISFPTDAMTRVIKAGGYDGMKDGRDWVAFDSNQIKSATGNKGTFDATNPDIRYSLGKIKPEIINTFNEHSKYSNKEVVNSIEDIENSKDVYAKSYAFSMLAKSEGYKVSTAGDKYLTLTKGDIILHARISDHSRTNKGIHFQETDINIAPDDGYPIDSFESALFKLKNASVDEDGNTLINNKEPSRFSLKAPETPAFKRFFGDSKIVNPDGTPKVMYHGTARDITTFKPKQAGAIFLTDNPNFANTFVDLSEDYMIKEIYNKMTDEQRAEMYDKSLEQSRGHIREKEYQRLKNEDSKGTLLFDGLPRAILVDYQKNLLRSMPSMGNIIPAFVRSEYPFDYENPTHVKDVVNHITDSSPSYARMGNFYKGKIEEGDWEVIEKKEVQRAIKAMGHDGFYVKEDGFKNLGVYDSSQIKSATGNIGTYDRANPDIRASLGNLLSGIPNAAGLADRLNTVTPGREDVGHARRIINAINPKNFGDLRTNFFNRYNQLAIHDKMLAKSKGLVKLMADSSAEAAALMSDLASGIAAEAMGKNGGVPVFKNGYTSIDRSTKGLVEIFAPLAKMNSPDAYRLYQFWAGSKRARRLIKEGREENYTAADMAHAKEIEKMYGHIFEPVHKDWIKYNNGLVKYLVDTGVLSPSKAAEFSKYSDYIPFYRQVDGDTTVGPQLFQSMTGVKAPKKLKGGEGPLADFLETVVRNTHAAIQSGTKNVAATRAVKNAEELGLAKKVAFKQDKFNVVKIFEKGQESYYEVADPLMVNAMQGLNLPNLPFLGFFAAPANWLRNMVTKDPGFMLANMMKDSISAYITSGSNMTPVVDTVKHFTTAMAGTNPIIERLRAAGIGGGHLGGDIETAGRDLAKKLRKEAGTKTTLEKGLTPFTSLWEGLEHGTEASDLATRAAIYQKTMDETGNEAEAIYQALEVMNFYRKGANPLIRILSAVTPFLNARIQGLDVFYRTGFAPFLDENATEADKTRQKAFFVRGTTLIALSAAYWALTHDDDDYKKQEQETRDNNWLIPSLGIKMPIPFEVGFLFKVIPERILEYSYGNDTGKDFMASMRRGITSTLAIQAPQILQPIIETQTNFSFFTGRAIVPQGLQNVAPEFQVGPSTTKTFEALGKEFGQSPIMLEHLWQGYTGTMGMYIVDAIDSIINSNSDTPKATKRFEQMPFIKRFALDPQARGSVSSYYDLKDSVDQAVRTANLLEKTNNFEDLSQYMQDNAGLLATDDYVKAMDKDMKDLQNQASMVRASSLSADDKRDVLKAIGEAQNALTANVQYLKKMMSQR